MLVRKAYRSRCARGRLLWRFPADRHWGAEAPLGALLLAIPIQGGHRLLDMPEPAECEPELEMCCPLLGIERDPRATE